MAHAPSLLRRAAAIPALLGLLALGGCAYWSDLADPAALGDAARPAPWAAPAQDTSPETARPWLGPTQCGRCCGAGSGVITVASDPPGARCTLTRDGTRLAEIVTPAQVTLVRGNSPVTLSCSAPGRMATTTTLYPLRDFAVWHHQPRGDRGTAEHRRDIETGRVRRFFDTTVHLPPDRFASAAERDAWFAARAEATRAAWAEPIARARRSAAARYNGMIDSPETLTRYMQNDLAALDALRGQAQVAPATAARGR